MRKQLITAILYTIVTTVLLGIAYPVGITVISHLLMRDKADGQMITRNGELIGSHLIGQTFTGPDYFNSRPSAAGTGYDAANSSGSNLGPTNAALVARVQQSVQSFQAMRPGVGVPIDLVTASASGLDPDITPAAAEYQAAYVARARGLTKAQVESLVQAQVQPRQFGILGEPRVNVLQLNLALDELAAHGRSAERGAH
jgi:K+-transporting ATPase ATPase C chain